MVMDYISTGAANNIKGRGFEKQVHSAIFRSANDLFLNNSSKNTLDYYVSTPEFKILRNVMIGGHEIDVAIVNEECSKLIEMNVSDIGIGDRPKSAYLMIIECKDYEDNIGADRAVDLLAKNYILRPNESIIVKKDKNIRFNWPFTFDIAGARMIEFSEDLGSRIRGIISSGSSYASDALEKYSSSVLRYGPGLKVRSRVRDNSKYKKGNSTLDNILKKDFSEEGMLSAVNIKSLPVSSGGEKEGACFNANAAVVKLDSSKKYLHNQDLFIVNYNKDADLNAARQAVGSLILSGAAKAYLYCNNVTRDAKEFAERFNDILEIRITSF